MPDEPFGECEGDGSFARMVGICVVRSVGAIAIVTAFGFLFGWAFGLLAFGIGCLVVTMGRKL